MGPLKLRDGDYEVLFAVRRLLNRKYVTTVRDIRYRGDLTLASPQITAALARLEKVGYVNSGFRRGKKGGPVTGPKVYRLTAKGRAATR